MADDGVMRRLLAVIHAEHRRAAARHQRAGCALRRQCTDALTTARRMAPERRIGQWNPGMQRLSMAYKPKFIFSFLTLEQLTPALLNRKPDYIYLPLGEVHRNLEVISGLTQEQAKQLVTKEAIYAEAKRRSEEMVGQTQAKGLVFVRRYKLADGTIVQLREDITIDLPDLPKDVTDSFATDIGSMEIGTGMDASDLSNFFAIELPLGSEGVIANGEGKAEALYNAFCGPITPECPASILQLHKDTVLLLDKDAASLL